MSWTSKPTDFVKQFKANTEKDIKRFAGDVLSGVVVGTPVDTGQARSNWNVAIDSTDYSTTTVVSDAISRGLNKLNVSEILGKQIVISNSLPYIIRLNEGWSQQAPAKFVEKTIINVSSKYK